MFDKIDKKIFYIFRSFFVFLIFWFSSYFQYIPVWLFHLDVHNLSQVTTVLLSFFSSSVIFLIFMIIYWNDLKKEFILFKKDLMKNMDIGFKYWMYGLAIMIVSNLILTYFFKAGIASNEKVVQKMIEALPAFMLIEAGFIAPFNEEIAFRKTLKDIFTNKWFFAIISFLLFGGAHVIHGTTTLVDYLYIIPYGVLGGAFALAYYETDTIFTSMSMHMIHNTILILLSIFFI